MSFVEIKDLHINIRMNIPNNAMDRLNVRPGDSLYALIKKENVNIVQSG